MSEQLEQGKKWVEDKLQELAEKHEIEQRGLVWGYSEKDNDFDKNRWSLKIATTGSKALLNLRIAGGPRRAVRRERNWRSAW